ncbi:hypothetical protein LMG19146_00128 [Xanthomonas arboricola pv. fragariae]|nr:hypothetical protein LMG19146_00128 [Xanthomonas arboricola pv. fragariae]
MHMLCCGKATPRGHSRCMPVAICAERLRKCAASRIAGRLRCDRNAAGCWRRTRGSDAHRNCDMRRTARGIIRTQRAAQHAQSPPCCCPINTHARAKSPGAIAELRHLPCAACDRCGLRHAFRSGQPMHLLQQAAGIVAAMDAARGGQSSVDAIGDAWQDRADGAQKKTVAAATATTTVIDLPARLTWSRGGRTCSESTSAACRCRPCPAAR